MTLYDWGCFCILVDTAHIFCPLALAFWRRDLRPDHFQFPPLTWALLGLAACLPLSGALIIYFWWNIWHFGSQNYGVLRLWRGRQPPWAWWLCMGVTAAGMLSLPFMLAWALFDLTHWLTDIYLSSSRSQASWVFAGCVLMGGGAVLALSIAGYGWSKPTPNGYRMANEGLFHFRIVLGCLHFMLSRELWRRGSPIMSAA